MSHSMSFGTPGLAPGAVPWMEGFGVSVPGTAPGSVVGMAVAAGISVGGGAVGLGEVGSSSSSGSGSSPSTVLFKWLLRGIVLYEGWRYAQVRRGFKLLCGADVRCLQAINSAWYSSCATA
jgi:hypothetical protein